MKKIQSYGFWILVIAIAILFIRSCNLGCGLRRPSRSDTISIKRDTVWIHEGRDTIYQPIPLMVTNTIYKPLYKTDTIEITNVDPTDTAAILARFYQMVYYSDTQVNKYGKIIIQDSITQNRIKNRRFITDMNIPEATNTITIRDKRVVGYFGASMIGSPITPLYAAGVDFSLKLRNDRIYTLGSYFTKDGIFYYTAGFKLPIRFRRE